MEIHKSKIFSLIIAMFNLTIATLRFERQDAIATFIVGSTIFSSILIWGEKEIAKHSKYRSLILCIAWIFLIIAFGLSLLKLVYNINL